MVDTHKCLNCGETMTEEQSKSSTGCPHCYSKKSIVKRSPADVGENHHQENVVMAAKKTPAAKKAPEKKAPVTKPVTPEKKAPVKPEPKKETAPKKPTPAPAEKDTPVNQVKVPEKAKTTTPPATKGKAGVKQDTKAYAAKVKAEAEAAAAKKKAAAKPVELSEEDKKREAARLEKLAKKKAFLNEFTKNGAPALVDGADDDAKALHAHNLAAYNEFVAKTTAEINALSIPVTSESPAAHVVQFGKDGTAKKLTPEEGAKQLAKQVKAEGKAQKALKEGKVKVQCICPMCQHNPAPKLCERCDQQPKSCKQTKGTCPAKNKSGYKACVDSAIEQKMDSSFIAGCKLQWGVA